MHLRRRAPNRSTHSDVCARMTWHAGSPWIRGALFFFIAACSSSSPAAPASTPVSTGDGSTTPSSDDGGTLPTADASPEAASLAEGGADPFALFAACAPNPAAGDYPLDVGAVLGAKCQTCHKKPPINHAPFPLLNYEDTVGPDTIAPYKGRPIWQAMHVVIQPNGVPHMPFGNAPQLTAEEFRTLDGWLTSCAPPVPEGTGGDSDSAQRIADAATEPADAAAK
jgi:hypothetical protein